MVIKMLNLTLTSGDGVQIGEDVQIVFESTPSVGRIKIKIEAPRDKNIARMPVEKKRKGNVVIVKRGRQKESGESV
ncbi:carbon storage regulator [Lachnospiraceae bacterium 54-11]